MPATITVVQNSGWVAGTFVAEIAKDISNLISVDDGNETKEDNPLGIPKTGIVRSFETWIRCRCDVAPATSCTNFKSWYLTGLPEEGFTLKVNSSVINTYEQPSELESLQGTRADFTDSVDAGSAINLAGVLINIGDYTSWLVFQLEITKEASPGISSLEYMIEWDES
jgi:hypothetical protein